MRRLIRELIETVLMALLLFVALQFSVQNFRVEGSSMGSTLSEGRYLLVNKLVYLRFDLRGLAPCWSCAGSARNRDYGSVFVFHPPEHGDIVIFHYPDDPSRSFVKRVIGVPGDEIEIEDGQVFRNGVALDEGYIHNPDTRSYRPVNVPEGSLYVLGDSRRASNDSRSWGVVPVENVVGRAWVTYWPLRGFGLLQ